MFVCLPMCCMTDWLGELFDYCRKVRVEVFNELETRQITNVFGIIHGQEEPGLY